MPMAWIGRVPLRCRKKLEHNSCNMKWGLDPNDFKLRRRRQKGFDDAWKHIAYAYGLNRARTVALQNETWTQLLQYEAGAGSQWFQIATQKSKRFWWRLEKYSLCLWLESGACGCVAERNLNTIEIIWSGSWLPMISNCDADVKTVLMTLGNI